MPRSLARLLATSAVALVAFTAAAQDGVPRTPLAPDHPVIGTWHIDVPGTNCSETYTFHPDGTTRVHSAAEVVESAFDISATPSAAGFYKWVDRVTMDNGRPDCTGDTVGVGHVATNYLLFHPSRREFLLCRDESLSACIGPFLGSQGI